MRPFLLYHWSPQSRRKGIVRCGLCPRKKSRDGEWRPPYLCFSRYPNTAWALSATHSAKRETWDLWCVWSDEVGPYVTLNTAPNPKKAWWRTEYRSGRRIPKSKIWLVGSRVRDPRRRS